MRKRKSVLAIRLVSDYGTRGQVIETLPKGFIYRRSTLGSGRVESEDEGEVPIEKRTNKWKFTLRGETSFDYTVIAPDSEGTYTFSGRLKDMKKRNTMLSVIWI